MKKSTKSIISTVLATVLALSVFVFMIVAITGCASVEESSDFITYSNGGSVVEYGEYIYFINGVDGFPTSEIQEDVNVAGEVEKGGLYRVRKHEAIIRDAELKERAAAGTLDEHDKGVLASYKKHENIDLESTEMDWMALRNYSISDYHDYSEEKGRYIPHFEQESDVIEYQVTGNNATLVAGKLIGTGNYAGGIFIFDERIYFASPANSVDKEGNYQYNKVDFFTCTLDGKNLTKLYTTTGTTDPAAINATDEATEEGEETDPEVVSIPYNFTKQNGKVYLTTFEQWFDTEEDEKVGKMTGFLVTTEINNGIPGRSTIVAKNVLGAYLPVNETYDPDASVNTINDFIYFIRKAENDVNNYGTVIEMMRPNGDDRDVIINNNKTATIEGISGDFLYYRNISDSATSLEYTNLRPQLENSSYERVIDSNGYMVYKKDKEGNRVRKSGGKTFLDEQEKLQSDFDDWQTEGAPQSDERFVAYKERYIMPMTNTNHVIIENINDNQFTSFFLVPQKASFDMSNVYVIAATSNYMYKVGTQTGSNLLLAQVFTSLITDGTRIFGFDSNQQYGYMYINTSDPGTNLYTLSSNMPYTTVSNATYLMMDLLTIHDNKGNLVHTYAAYFTNYPNEKATNYMAIAKIMGGGEGYGPTPVAYVLPSELKEIHCMDPDCIDYTHNHVDRDGYEPGVDPNAEEEGDQSQMM